MTFKHHNVMTLCTSLNPVAFECSRSEYRRAKRATSRRFEHSCRMESGFGKCEPQNSRADGTWAPGRGWAIVGKRKLETEANNGGGDIELVDGGPTYPSVTTVYTQI